MKSASAVARIESCRSGDGDAGEHEAELVRRGIASPPRARLDLDASWPFPYLACRRASAPAA